MVINYCGLSGGKDSSGTTLWLIHESGVPRESIRFTFCDTENEHRFVYEHVAMLSEYVVKHGCQPVVTLHPERGFMELARWKGRFPSRRARFCTQFLKVIPTREDVQSLIRNGHEVIVHSGVRAGESADRAKLVDRGFDDMFGCTVNRPLLRKSLEQVVAMHKTYGVPLNKLYSYGFKRVGCFPCINSNKSEIKLISIHFPERIDELRSQELDPNFGRGISTFFHAKTVPPRFRSRTVPTKDGRQVAICTIDDVVRWSHTGKGARERTPALFEDFYDDDKTLVCPSGAGMCE
jgi:3'-phosphoadenosine 5'-phosphosulfate sulfotransferase (PAPS reductase)/FAD synthetase